VDYSALDQHWSKTAVEANISASFNQSHVVASSLDAETFRRAKIFARSPQSISIL
jgi:hypothetical protein